MPQDDPWNDHPPRKDPLRSIEEASKSGHLERVVSLIARLSPTPQDLQRSLNEALGYKHLHVAQHLLNKGAAIDDMAAYAAVNQAKSLPVFEFLFARGWGVSAPVPVAQMPPSRVVADESVVGWLLDRGADPNLGSPPDVPDACVIGSSSGVVLEGAVYYSSIVVFDLLLERGAELENSLPLHSAAEWQSDRRIPMMEHLLELGVDMNGSDDKRRLHGWGTPLHYAIRARHTEHVRFLLQRGADPRAANLRDKTALEAAWGQPQVVELLEKALQSWTREKE
ncbi:hypothetical protein FGG08_003093 [Glutinoglossum americanum]|uniref:Ankyrin n=1 Tax=Glutinoglossum americanum TaxID=1670608 RepID=A0A9P8I505_9PEZI|nr:hypothetical protein FGG08_003093 [Glutinoglossum americanum]